MNAARIDSFLAARHGICQRQRALAGDPRMQLIPTHAANIRVLDTGGNLPALLITPDGPCVIEHYFDQIKILSEHYRVICFDMPGFGFSYPRSVYGFGLAETADAIVELMDALKVQQAILAFSCANGFFGMNLAQRYPQRVSHLVLSQTPSLQAMFRWTDRIVPKPLKIPYVGQVIMAATARKFSVGWFDLSLPRDSEFKAGFAATAKQAVASGGCFCLASLVQGVTAGSDSEVKNVECPTLLFYGDNDFSHKYTDFNSLKDLIPQAQTQRLEGCGHFPDLERSAEFNRGLRAFTAA